MGLDGRSVPLVWREGPNVPAGIYWVPGNGRRVARAPAEGVVMGAFAYARPSKSPALPFG